LRDRRGESPQALRRKSDRRNGLRGDGLADGVAEVASDDESESRCDTTAQAPTPAAAATARTAPTLKRERRGALCGASVASGCGSCWPMTQGTAVIWPEDTSCRACASDGSKTSTS
jgi:hypothetical protein